MKVISGIYKGRNILGYDIDGTRPTMDRVKESLFAIIQNYINDSVVLDLFSGSGNLAIESLSQGASVAYAVDNNRRAVNTIEKNINTIGVENLEVLNLDYKKAINYFYDNTIKFDIIFLDPPYKTTYIDERIKLISKYKILNEEGIIVAESSSIDKIVYPDEFSVVKSKKYGDKWVVILK